MMNEVLKSGNLMKYSDSVFSTKWKYNFVELLKNSTIRWYENKSDHSPKRSVHLKSVSSFLAFGDIIRKLPFKPDLKGNQVNLMIAIPHENNKDTRLSFFLCSNETELQEWVNAILSTVSDNGPVPPSGSGPMPPTSMGSGPPGGPGYMPPVGGPPPYQAPPYGAGSGPPPPGVGGPPYGGGGPPPGVGGPPYGGGGPPPGSGGPPIGFNFGGASGAPGGYMPGNPPPPNSGPPGSNYYGGPPPPSGYPSSSAAGPGYHPPPPQQTGGYGVPSNPNYPRQQGYPTQYGAPYAAGMTGYTAGMPPQQGYNQQQPQQVVIVDGKKRKKKHKGMKNAAVGLAAGAAGAYMTHKMFGGFGHGWGGGWGMHHGGHFGGSWSSLSSFGSFSGGSWSFSD